MSKLEEIKEYFKDELEIFSATDRQEMKDMRWLIARVEKLEAFVNNFVGLADRVELATWEKGRLSVMNFDPKSLSEDETKGDA